MYSLHFLLLVAAPLACKGQQWSKEHYEYCYKKDPNRIPGCDAYCYQKCTPNPCDKFMACVANGCECKEGYVLNEKIDRCVLPEDCPPPEPCNDPDPNKEDGCGTYCGHTCDDYINKTETSCDDINCLINGCKCKKGYYYKKEFDRCVLPEECNTMKSLEEIEKKYPSKKPTTTTDPTALKVLSRMDFSFEYANAQHHRKPFSVLGKDFDKRIHTYNDLDKYTKVETKENETCIDSYIACTISQVGPEPVCAFNRFYDQNVSMHFWSANSFCDVYLDNCKRGYRVWRIFGQGACRTNPKRVVMAPTVPAYDWNNNHPFVKEEDRLLRAGRHWPAAAAPLPYNWTGLTKWRESRRRLRAGRHWPAAAAPLPYN